MVLGIGMWVTQVPSVIQCADMQSTAFGRYGRAKPGKPAGKGIVGKRIHRVSVPNENHGQSYGKRFFVIHLSVCLQENIKFGMENRPGNDPEMSRLPEPTRPRLRVTAMP
jgi:hypothetical protein